MNIPYRLKSRKFWLTVSGALTLALNNQWTEFVALVSAYIISEGAADTAERIVDSKPSITYSTVDPSDPFIEEDNLNTSKVEPGTTLFDEKRKD